MKVSFESMEIGEFFTSVSEDGEVTLQKVNEIVSVDETGMEWLMMNVVDPIYMVTDSFKCKK